MPEDNMDGDQAKQNADAFHASRDARRDEATGAVVDYPREFKGQSPIRVNKLGHIVYEVTNPEHTANFWKQVMGFQETDRNELGMIFLRFGVDHHSIGLKPSKAKGRPARGEALKVEHLAFEVDTMDMLFEARDYLKANNIPMAFEGRKGAGGNTSLHFLDPDGFEFEIYYKMDQIDEDGHLRPDAQFRRAGSLEEAAANPLPAKKW
jgi:catechol 2,3-dioxygenase-like lactoylglutathione lyase family enzyme